MRSQLFVLAVGAAAASALMSSQAAAGSPSCATDAIGLSTSAPASPGDATQIHFDVIVTNTSTQSCELFGYPGVDLVGPDDPTWGPDYQLPQQAGNSAPVTLAPGASATSRLTFLADPNGWVPNAIAVTLPNSPGLMQTPWIAGGVPLARQDGASHPGSYIGPFQPADLVNGG